MLLNLSLSIDSGDPEKATTSTDHAKLIAAGHFGTHLDTYLQSEIPLEYFRRRGVCIDVSGLGNGESTLEQVRDADIRSGDFVIFHTGFLKKTGYGGREYFRDHPQLSWELIEFLIAQKISFIGIDAAGVRRGTEHVRADRHCEDRGLYIIENLANVDLLQEAAATSSFTVFTGWPRLRGYSGLMCSVIAETH